MNITKEHLSKVHRDLTRPVLLLGLLTLLFVLDTWAPGVSGRAELSPLLTTVALVVGGVVVTHVVRRVLFPRLDIQGIALKACQESLGAGLVFASVLGFAAVVLNSVVALLR